MHVSKEFVGKLVSVQVGRPLYMIDYAAHFKFKDRTFLAGEPVMNGEKPLAMDIIIGSEVVEVLDDNITLKMMTPGGNVVRKTIPTALILSIDEVLEFESDNLPDVTKRVRQASPVPAGAPASKIIL